MTSQYRHRRSSNPSTSFTALEPGEIAVNTASRQLSVGDAAAGTIGQALPLLPIRIFDLRAIYAANDFVIQSGVISRAKYTTGPGAFDTVAWDAVAGAQVGPYVLRGGDTMFGHLSLPTLPAADQAVRRDYVDTALAPYATRVYVDTAVQPLAFKTYVDTQDTLAVPKAGGTMTGPLTLSGPPTAANQAATKAYADTSGTPPGAILDFAMANPPTGWLTCDGQAIDRTVYASLFAAIGTLWGSGNGSTTFNVPNFMTRYRRHRDNNPSYANIVGNYQSPCNLSHTHSVNITSGYMSADHAHYTSGTTNAADRSIDHLHSGVPQRTGTFTSGAIVGSSGAQYVHPNTGNSGAADRSIDHLHTFGAWSGGVNANHNHGVSGDTGIGTSDYAYEARPYSATVLTCIKT